MTSKTRRHHSLRRSLLPRDGAKAPAALRETRAAVLTAAAVITGAAILTGIGASGCAAPRGTPFDPVALQRLERQSARDLEYRRLPPLVTDTYDPEEYDPFAATQAEIERGLDADIGQVRPAAEVDQQNREDQEQAEAAPAANVVRLPLREAIRRATINNFDVAVAGYEPAIAETRVSEAMARFDPIFGVTGEFQDQERQTAGQSFFDVTGNLITVDTDRQRLVTLGTSVRQIMPSGGEARLSYQARRADITPRRFDINPSYESELSLQFTQPLLRDFGRRINRARIVISQNDQRIGLLEFRSRLEDVLLQTERTYWQLYQAQQDVLIQRELLQRTIDTADMIAGRIDIDARQEQMAQAVGRIHARRGELLRAETNVAQLSDQLKALMNDPDLPITAPILVEAADVPITQPLLFDLEEAVAGALLHRSQIGQQLLRVENATSAMGVARSNLLPQLDAILTSSVHGLDDTYAGAVVNQLDLGHVSYGAGLRLEIPIGNRSARAIMRRALLQREQAITAYQSLINAITLEVSQTQRQVSANYAVLGELRRARLAAAEAVETIEILAQDVALTPEFSDRQLRFLDELGAARRAELGAIASYNISLAEYERAKGTLLRYNNIVLEEAFGRHRLPAGR